MFRSMDGLSGAGVDPCILQFVDHQQIRKNDLGKNIRKGNENNRHTMNEYHMRDGFDGNGYLARAIHYGFPEPYLVRNNATASCTLEC